MKQDLKDSEVDSTLPRIFFSLSIILLYFRVLVAKIPRRKYHKMSICVHDCNFVCFISLPIKISNSFSDSFNVSFKFLAKRDTKFENSLSILFSTCEIGMLSSIVYLRKPYSVFLRSCKFFRMMFKNTPSASVLCCYRVSKYL